MWGHRLSLSRNGRGYLSSGKAAEVRSRMSTKQIRGGLQMLKQFSVHEKIFGAMICLFAWSLFTEQASADDRTGTIAFLSDRHEMENPLFRLIYQFM